MHIKLPVNQLRHSFGAIRYRFFLIMLALFFSCLPLAAMNRQKVWSIDDPVYNYLEHIFIETGLGLPFQSKPYTTDEIYEYLGQIQTTKLSATGVQCYNKILQELQKTPSFKFGNEFAFDSSYEIGLEGYYKTNEAIEWIHGYEKRLPMVNIPFEVWSFDWLYASMELFFKENHGMCLPDLNNYSNVISIEHNFAELDWNVPLHAFVSLGGNNWNLFFGRDRFSWGAGKTGQLLLSDYADYHDAVRFTTYWPFFKFTSVYLEMDPYTIDKELPSEPEGVDPYHAFFARQIEIGIGKKLNIAFAESLILGKQYPELRNFNPIMIMHNMRIPERANYLVTIDLDYSPYRYTDMYLQLALDEIEPNLRGLKDLPLFQLTGLKNLINLAGDLPDTIGFLAGTELVFPFADGYFNGTIEFVHNSPWLYNYDHFLLKYLNRRQTWSPYPPKQDTYDKPLGYHEGPDVQVFFGRIGFEKPTQYRISASITHTRKGELTLLDEYLSKEDNFEIAPTGTVEKKTVFHFSFEKKMFTFFSLGGGINVVRLVNHNHEEAHPCYDVQVNGFVMYKRN